MRLGVLQVEAVEQALAVLVGVGGTGPLEVGEQHQPVGPGRDGGGHLVHDLVGGPAACLFRRELVGEELVAQPAEHDATLGAHVEQVASRLDPAEAGQLAPGIKDWLVSHGAHGYEGTG